MSKTIILISNSLDSAVETAEVDGSVLEWIMSKFPHEWPETAHIYHTAVAEQWDITPRCEEDFAKIESLDGPFYVVVYPGYEEAAYAIYVLIVVLLVAVVITMRPPSVGAGAGSNILSPNNSLSNRQNQARPNARIPDIYGTVRSVPDLLSVPYKEFVDNQEVEVAYMCVGRGSYDIDADSVLDDATPISTIPGASVEIYGPNTSPNNANGTTIVPQLTIGDPIGRHLLDARRYSSVNGQTLQAPDAFTLTTRCTANGEGPPYNIQASGVDFTTFCNVGDSIQISGSAQFQKDHDAHGLGEVSLNGTYTVSSVTSGAINFDHPEDVNSNWDLVGIDADSDADSTIRNMSAITWVGPFIMPLDNANAVWINIVAENGLFKENSNGVQGVGVWATIELTPVDSTNTPTGSPVSYNILMAGHGGSDKGFKGSTVKIACTGRQSVRVQRTTDTVTIDGGNASDEIKWRDMYGVASVFIAHFGNVTTVQSVTYATEGALAIKDRKLNMIATRKLPQRVSGSTFSTTLYPTNNAADILSAICLDSRIGARSASEVDFDNIYDIAGTTGEIATYFGTTDCAEFCYTFDDTNISFEETVAYIADAIFSTAFRRGNLIQLTFEKTQTDSTLLFNHRNKVPGSETRSVRFGNADNNDGVNFKWVDPTDESSVTYYIPENQSATNAKEIQSTGVRNLNQAYLLAYRAWNKIRYQNVMTEFEGTQESDLLVKGDRILVADNTRSGTNDGYIVSVAGLKLELSQPYPHTGTGHAEYIFLQLSDGSVQGIQFTWNDDYHVTLSTAPRLALVTDSANYAVTTYMITWDTKPRQQAFLVIEKESKTNYTSKVKAVNYDDRYYQNDGDYTDGLIS